MTDYCRVDTNFNIVFFFWVFFTELKFMTDGVLTKEIESDFALRKYGAIIIDEVSVCVCVSVCV